MKYTAIIEGERFEVGVEQREHNLIEMDIGGRKYAIEGKAVEPGIYWLNWNNQSLEVGVTRSIAGYVVSLRGKRILVEIVDARTALRRAVQQGHAGVAEIRAPMPGKVVKLLAAEGAEVEANQGIVVMEAMKMQNEIKSPKKGVVGKLNVVEGAAVNSGDLLATVE